MEGEEQQDSETEIDRAEMYRILSERYGWTPMEIAQLTPKQIISWLQCAGEGDTITFGSLQEYRQFRNIMTMRENK